MCQKSNKEIATLVDTLKVAQKGKKKILVDRLEGKKSAFAKAVTRASKRWRDDIGKGDNYPSCYCRRGGSLRPRDHGS